ncbi:hypothetical protein UlMin_036526 [Ulmus minor]
MSSDNYVQPAIPRFDGHYDHWSMLMENFLRSKEYWTIVEIGVTEPASGEVLTEAQQKKLEEQRLKDLKAKNYLFQAIDRSILETILQKDTCKQIWDSMKKKYQGSSRTLQMKDGESITDYCARTMGIINKMRFHGEKMEDLATVEKILRSLVPKYDYVVRSIEESKDIDELSFDELQSSLLVHEQKMNRNSATDVQALKASTFAQFSNSRGRGRGRGRGGRGNRDGSRQYHNYKADKSHSNYRGRDQQPDKSKIKCYRCHKFGHYRSECYTKLPYDKEKVEKSNFAAEKNKSETLLMAYHVNEEIQSDVSYVDTGCSNHMCGSKSFFFLFK